MAHRCAGWAFRRACGCVSFRDGFGIGVGRDRMWYRNLVGSSVRSWVRSLSSKQNEVGRVDLELDREGHIEMKDFTADRIRNFCIISHIDHG
jgi:hypothetical protein